MNPDTHLPKTPFYKLYTALITQTGTNNPVINELQNTLGETATWTRDSTGIYIGTFTGAPFTDNTILSLSNVSGRLAQMVIIKSGNATIQIQTGSAGILTDDVLQGEEIRIKIKQ